VNLILKSIPVNWKAITGGYRLTEFCIQVQHLSLIISVFNVNIYTGAPKIHCEYLKLKIKMICKKSFQNNLSFKCSNTKMSRFRQVSAIFCILLKTGLVKFKPVNWKL